MPTTQSPPILARDSPEICITGATASEAEGNGSVEKAGSSSTWKPSFVGYDPEPDPRKMLAAVTKRIRRQGRQKALASKAEAKSEQNEPPPTPYAQGDVSQVVENLASEGCELFSKGAKAVLCIANHQLPLFESDVVPAIPSIVKLMLNARIEGRQACLIGLLSSLGAASPTASKSLEGHLDLEVTIRMLRESAPMVRVSLIKLLDGMLSRAKEQGERAKGEKLEDRVKELLRAHLYTLASASDGRNDDIGSGSKGEEGATPCQNIEAALGAVQIFGLSFKHGGIDIGLATLKAGGVEFLLQIARTSQGPLPTITDLRSTAITCLDGVLTYIKVKKIVPGHFSHLPLPKLEPRLELQGHILKVMLDLVDDPDLTISDQVVELLYCRYRDPGNAVEIFLWTHEGSLGRLVHKLALGGGKYNGRPGDRVAALELLMAVDVVTPEPELQDTYHGARKRYSGTSWLLQAFFERIPQGVVGAFGKFWAAEGVEDATRDRLARVLASIEVHRELKRAAICAGIPVPAPDPSSLEEQKKRAEVIARREEEYKKWVTEFTSKVQCPNTLFKMKL